VLRVVAMVLFGLMFLAEAGDLYGLVLTLADPVPAADRFGITASAEVLRSTVLLILALVVCLGALLALVGLLARSQRFFTRAPWCARSDTLCTASFRWLTVRCNSARP
jgi:hypothetical protein